MSRASDVRLGTRVVAVVGRHTPGSVRCAATALLLLLGVAPALADEPASPAAADAPAAPPATAPRYFLPAAPQLEPKAVELLQAMGARLAAASTLQFTALATYEATARTGAPLAYTTFSEIALQRPDKLRVLTTADGPPSEFYYDGRTLAAYAPWTNFVAVADAPATVDAMLEQAFNVAGIYFPFSDVIVAEPYRDLADKLQLAFVVGQSHVVGGTLTDIVVIANATLQMQIWIGAEDRLPRRLRAIFFAEPEAFRHDVELADWVVDAPLPPGTFTSQRAMRAARIAFARPDQPPSRQQ